MTTTRRVAPAALLAGGCALALAACGGGGGGKNAAGKIPGPVSGQKKGGTLKVITNEAWEHLDPGASYFQIDYLVEYATQRPLYSFKPTDFTKPVPDMAAGEPQISADNKTVTIKIRPNVKFSPPVNRAVTSKDVKYAIERGFNPTVANCYEATYFANPSGAGRMDYPSRVEANEPIGSGVTEAACKTVFTQRLKQSGMTWKVEGGQWIVDLRVIHLSGVWSEVYQSYLGSKTTLQRGTQGTTAKRKTSKAA